MKFGTYLALVGAVTATKIMKGTGMDDTNQPVARSSAELHPSLAQAKHGDSSDDDEEKKAEPVHIREINDEKF